MGIIVYPNSLIKEVTITSNTGVQITIMSLGAIIRDWQVPVLNQMRSVTLGYPNFQCYLTDNSYMGAIIGRVANRIGQAQFCLNNKNYKLAANNGNHHLHGGYTGLHLKNWDLELDSSANSVQLDCLSPHGEGGYPGEVKFTVLYKLTDYQLTITMQAQVSEPTPINMVQHNYFNLLDAGNILDHLVTINADKYTVADNDLIPTGQIASVTNTFLDLRSPRHLRKTNGEPQPYDINYCLSSTSKPAFAQNQKFFATYQEFTRGESNPVCVVAAPDHSLMLQLSTDQPGLQFYTGEFINSQVPGLTGKRYLPFSGLALEDQGFPDAVNHPHFPTTLVEPPNSYSHTCKIEIK